MMEQALALSLGKLIWEMLHDVFYVNGFDNFMCYMQ